MPDKPPFKLSITLETNRPDAMKASIDHLNTLCNEHDQRSDVKTKVVIESWDEVSLLAIRAGIEAYIRQHRWVIDGKVTMDSPLIRMESQVPPMVELFNAPMGSDGPPRRERNPRLNPDEWQDDEYNISVTTSDGPSRRDVER